MDRESYIAEKSERARAAFTEGRNCCQAVLTAFAEELGLERDFLMRLGSGFGGGMGRLREVCGTVTALAMAESLLEGAADGNKADKDAVYAGVRGLAERFKQENGSIVCRELLAGVPVTAGGDSEARTEAYYKKRPCKEYCACAAGILAEKLYKADK